jgi:hypothetical protein
MTTSAGRDDAADFLRRLSIADARVLLERTRYVLASWEPRGQAGYWKLISLDNVLGRKEKENKTKEMQKMIGVRYRDLIESADKIVNMHSAALRLEVSLKEMPDKWKQMEMALASALAVEVEAEAVDQEDAFAISKEQQETELTADADKVAFLVEVPEKMWQLLDEGQSLQALELYQQASLIHDECVTKGAEQEFPFLLTQWTCIQCFRPVRWTAIGSRCYGDVDSLTLFCM